MSMADNIAGRLKLAVAMMGAATYLHLSGKLTPMFTKGASREAFVLRLPVEILSVIFGMVKEGYEKERLPKQLSTCSQFEAPWFEVPTWQLPQVLVSSVCKQWREVALKTPMLWTDIVLDLTKSADVQLWIVNEWARRSSQCPFNLTIFLMSKDTLGEQQILEDCKNVVKTLRPLAPRWNNVTLRVPWAYSYRLLNGLERLSTSSMFCIQDKRFGFDGVNSVRLQHPLCPHHFCCDSLPPSAITFNWDKLIHLEITGIDMVEFLDVIQNAPNLAHCVANGIVSSRVKESTRFPRYVTSRSLLHLEAMDAVLDRLTLPSLHTLKYHSMVPAGADTFVKFVQRSHPPLQTLYLMFHEWDSQLGHWFQPLSGVTRLSIMLSVYNPNENQLFQPLTDSRWQFSNIILPHLQELEYALPFMTPACWSLFRRLFPQDGQLHWQSLGAFGRPLSKVSLSLFDKSVETTMDKKTLLHLHAVRKSGVGLHLMDSMGRSLFVG